MSYSPGSRSSHAVAREPMQHSVAAGACTSGIVDALPSRAICYVRWRCKAMTRDVSIRLRVDFLHRAMYADNAL